jgi:S-adenosylmethionine synthetase
VRRCPGLVVETLGGPPLAQRRTELVERKGISRPDTICDSLVEAIAVSLNRMYVRHLGAVAHSNIDKALLIAGQCHKAFGQGEVTRSGELIVGDRATFEVGGRKLPVEATAQAAVDRWLADHVPAVAPHVRTRIALAPGSAELASIFAAGAQQVLSNDTAPLSPAEEFVLAVEQFPNSPAFKSRFPDTGQDVKVFGRRQDDRLEVTVAMPLFAAAIPSEHAYFQRKAEVLAAPAERFASTPFALGWALNNLDVPGRGSDGSYLTVTGTSAEDGDSLAEVYVNLAGRIGEPVDGPWFESRSCWNTGTADRYRTGHHDDGRNGHRVTAGVPGTSRAW